MRHDIRFFVPALLCWAVTAALVPFAHQGYLFGIWALLIAGTAAAIAVSFRRSRGGLSGGRAILRVIAIMLALSMVLTAVIAMRTGFEHNLRFQSQLGEAANSKTTVQITAFATSTPVESQMNTRETDELRVAATVVEVRKDGQLRRTSVPVLLNLPRQVAARIGIGSLVRAEGTVRTMPGLSSVPFAISADFASISGPAPFLALMNSVRAQLRAEATKHDGWGAQLIPGLAVGDTQLVESRLDAAMKTSSLSHLTAVSGANCAIIVAIILMLGSAFQLRRWIRVLLAAIFLAAFIALVTPEPSVLRAGVMSAVALLGMISARKGAGVAALGVAIVALLIIDPWQATHLGFVLSVLATGGILLFAQPIAQTLQRYLPTWAALTIAVPLAAQFACQPAIILMQPTLPTFGILANVLAAPAAPIATITGLIACLALPVWGWLGEFFTWLTWWPATWISLIARLTSELPAAQLPWLEGWLGVALLAIIGIGILLAFFRGQNSKNGRANDGERSGTSMRGWQWITGAFALSLLLAIAVVRPLATVASIPPNWRIFACDVGQGDALLVRGSAGVMLIDTGAEPRTIATCLDTVGVRRVDVLVLTHDDHDHVGGLSGVIDRVRVAILAPNAKSSPKVRGVKSELERANVNMLTAVKGLHGSLGDLTWKVLWPNIGASPQTTNDSSVIIYVSCAEMDALFLGDLGEQSQQELVRLATLPVVDVVKVSHHGSADQLPELYERINATFGIISVGRENRYGHPTSTLLNVLSRLGTVALRTDRSGSLAIARDSKGKWQLWNGSALG